MASLTGRLDLDLEGRTALVTGVAGGIGRQVADLLAAAGANVFGTDANADALSAASADWAGDGHETMPADLGDPGQCGRVVVRAHALHGRLDIVVAVHALLVRREMADVDAAEFDRQMNVNARAQYFLAQAALPLMTRAGFGRIVLFTSPAGYAGSVARASAYAMSKGAAIGLARSIARRHGPDNITCNLVAPGSIDTPMLRGDLGDAELNAITGAIPLRRLGDPAEVAYGVLYLVGRWGGYVNGHMLVVDGGAAMGA